MSEKLHIYYPLKKSTVGECEEIKYSLRALETHLKADFDVTIIGYRPSWLDISKVRFIHYSQCDKRYQNALHAKEIMANIVDSFVVFNDDFYLISDVTADDLKQVYFLEDLNDTKNWGTRIYQQLMKKGFEEIKAKGYYGLSYATHTPRYYKSDIVKKIIYDEFDLWSKEFVAFENYYYNYIGAEKFAKLVKPIKIAKYDDGLFDPKETEGKIFLNFDEKGMESGIWDYVKNRFDKKSRFEQ